MTIPGGNGDASRHTTHDALGGTDGRRVEDFFDDLRARLTRVAQPLDLRLEEIERAVAVVRAAGAAATNYVRAKPVQSLAAAVVLGALVGVIAGRRR